MEEYADSTFRMQFLHLPWRKERGICYTGGCVSSILELFAPSRPRGPWLGVEPPNARSCAQRTAARNKEELGGEGPRLPRKQRKPRGGAATLASAHSSWGSLPAWNPAQFHPGNWATHPGIICLGLVRGSSGLERIEEGTWFQLRWEYHGGKRSIHESAVEFGACACSVMRPVLGLPRLDSGP